MKIELKKITVRDLVDGYQDNNEGGVVGYGGKLDIRPPFQREFVYDDNQRKAVIDTVTQDFPLNVMYWSVRDDGGHEVIDGQQRTISIAQYVTKVFSFDDLYFGNLQSDKQEKILNYELTIYLCDGVDSEKLKWFETINIAGAVLTNQELRNAVYHGSWVSDAKRWFSKSNCPAYGIGSKYLAGKMIRQEYLETAIKWLSKDNIEEYMGKHQDDPDASELWSYFENVIDWVNTIFPVYRKEMKVVEWGYLYNQHGNEELDPDKLETQIKRLMQDFDITNKKGIYSYVLGGKESHLNIRKFDDKQKREAYETQNGICIVCKKNFDMSEMEADHIDPWHEGGKTDLDNCQMLCREDNRRKSGK